MTRLVKFLCGLLLCATTLWLWMPETWATDKQLTGVSTNNFTFQIFDLFSNGITGRTFNTDYVVKVRCGSATAVQIDGTGDTVVELSGGAYHLVTNDTLSTPAETECLHWVEGAGSYAGLIAYTPEKVKALSMTLSGFGGVYGTLSAGSTGTSLISTAFTATDTTDYVGWVAVVNGGSAIVQSFNPATDTAVLATTIGTVTTGDTVYLTPASLWELLSRSRAAR